MIIPIHPEAALAELPIVKIVVIGMELRAASKGHTVDAVVGVSAKPSSLTKFAGTLIKVATANGSYCSPGIFGILGDDVDHAVHSVRSPDGPTWSTNDFDAIHVLQHHALQVPIHASKKRRIHATSIDENEDRFRENASESAYTHGPCAGVDSCDFHARHQAKNLGNAGGSRSPDILLRQDVDCRRGPLSLLRLLRDRRHLKVAELLKTQSL